MDETFREIRKLRKKLRQIHHLSALTRGLNDEELNKVSQLDAVQARLSALLASLPEDTASSASADACEDPAPDHDPGVELSEEEEEEAIVEVVEEEATAAVEEEEATAAAVEEEEAKVKIVEEQGEATAAVGEEMTPAPEPPSKMARRDVPPGPRGEERREEGGKEVRKSKEKAKEGKEKREGTETEQKKQQKAREPTPGRSPRRAPWWRRKPRFFVQELVGHSDIILDVSIADGLVVSASRDTLVKVWSMDTGLLECTLSGHSEAVQAVVLLPLAASERLLGSLSLPAGARLVVTGGGDSSLLLWRVDCSVRSASELRRIYVFTPVTCLALLPDSGSVVVAAGTSGGKIEVWDVVAKSQAHSRAIHRSAVTALRFLPGAGGAPGRLLSCSEGGEVAVHSVADLTTVFAAGDATPVPGRPLRTRFPISDAHAVLPLTAGADWLLVGDAGSGLKLVQRGHKAVRKVPNSKQEFGVCDGLWMASQGQPDAPTIVFATAFDLDTARGFLNVFNLSNPAQPAYLFSLQPALFAGRYLCVDGVMAAGGDQVEALVTGGVDLLLWQQVAPNSEFTAGECATPRLLALHRSADDELSHGETSASSDEWTDEDEDAEEEEERGRAARWWCLLL